MNLICIHFKKSAAATFRNADLVVVVKMIFINSKKEKAPK
jgi:hypothetical protein